MTVQLSSTRFGANKKVLQEQLNTAPATVCFEDPSFFAPRSFCGADIKAGESFAVVMDPATRRRFSTVQRKGDGTFKVS